MRIYITHCSNKKDDSLKNTSLKVLPERLYTARMLQRFIKKCKEKNANWAIFSDLHGVLFSEAEIEWYNKDPREVSENEFEKLVKDVTAVERDLFLL